MNKYSAEDERRYPIIHLKGNDIEMAITHGNQYGEEYYSFVNGQNTTQGGTHLQAFREAIVRTVREFYKKDYAPEDVRTSIVGAIAVRVQEPVFESQTKTKLGSSNVSPDLIHNLLEVLLGILSKPILITTYIKILLLQMLSKRELSSLNVSVRIWRASKNLRMIERKKRICIIKIKRLPCSFDG